MNQNLIKKWLIAQIKPNSYDLAVRNLERQGFYTFLPKMKTTIIKEKKFINKDVLLFPGYMFVGFSPLNSVWTKINSTYGVSKILVFNKKPAEISSDLILQLKIRYEINSNSKSEENLRKGDSIKFYTGPFTDLIAKIESVDEKNRIWILLDAMGGKQIIKLQNVEKNKYFRI